MERKSFDRLFLIVLFCLASSFCQAQQDASVSEVRILKKAELKKGDLLFHVPTKSNAITDVTPGMTDHVAIFLGGDSVVEAVGRGVVITLLDSLCRQEGFYFIGRIHKRKFNRKKSLRNALSYVGRQYDWLYLSDNDDIYCSELVTISYVDRKGKPLFALIPMSFHDASGRITEYWQEFYKRHNMEVPEGQPGSNPAELSQRPIIRIIGRLSPIL